MLLVLQVELDVQRHFLQRKTVNSELSNNINITLLRSTIVFLTNFKNQDMTFVLYKIIDFINQSKFTIIILIKLIDHYFYLYTF